MDETKSTAMSDKSEDLKKAVKEHSDKLAKSGTELGEIQFSYKIEEKITKEYWQKRIKDFKKYNNKGLEYYNQVYAIIKTVNNDEANRFLLQISKFQQLSTLLLESMDKIKENPSIIDSKDKQQSLWSKEIKNKITEQSNSCLRHEKDMNSSFREFYDKHLKKILE